MSKFINPRLIFIALVLTNLISCSSSGYISSSYTSAFNLIANQFLDDNPLTRDTVDDIPYASAIISFQTASQSLVILESTFENKNQWISADRIKFSEVEGRIVRTIGLPNDLYSIERPNLNFEFLLAEGNFEYVSYYSFRNKELNNLKVEITTQVKDKENISLLGIEKELILIEEKLYSPKINWRATNKYWIDPESFFVWKSKQALSPRLPYMDFIVTKKPAI